MSLFRILLTLTVVVVEMMAANPIVLPPVLLSSSICLIAPVDSSLYLLNPFDTFLQLFVMMIQNRHDDRMK